jgi:EAL domain-containing protein (putative c-di-GMP-specific phosphodiesterase class I)
VLARFGGDEFVILAERAGWDTADALVARLRVALAEPVRVGTRSVRVTASIGVVVSDGSGDADTVLRDADAAMYRAKDRGRDRAERFDAEMRERLVERVEIEEQLRRALRDGHLELHYQPEIALDDGRPVGVEALVRWHHPVRGLLGPEEFLPVAEDAGMMIELGEWVLEEACRQTAAWRRSGAIDDGLITWVNLSAVDLTDPSLPMRAAATLERTGAEASWIGIEITERALVHELDAVDAVLDQLRLLGFQLAIDDLGTGFSSLSYLKRFPVSFLKIDREFVSGLTQDAGDAAIVRAVVDLAHGLGLQAVAEGVEAADQALALRRLGCDIAQGYYISRPVPADELPAALDARVVSLA